MNRDRSTLYLLTAILTLLVIGASLLAWLASLDGNIGKYELFPILGLSAFGLMWMHYVSGSLKRLLGLARDQTVLKRYFTVTSYIVLALILLHPGIFYLGLFQDGFGLPPLSGLAVYTATGARIALLLGTISLLAFLLFETKRWFAAKPWWKYIEYASLAAMTMIFIHALVLGGELMQPWFKFFWIVLGIALAASVTYNYWNDRKGGVNGKQP